MSRHAWRRAGTGVYLTRMLEHNAGTLRIDTPRGKVWVATVDGEMLPGTHVRVFDAKRAAERYVTRIAELKVVAA